MTQIFDNVKFSKAIKTKRFVELNLTLRQVAKKTKVSFSTLSRVENEMTPDLPNLLKICSWLDIPAGEFITTKK